MEALTQPIYFFRRSKARTGQVSLFTSLSVSLSVPQSLCLSVPVLSVRFTSVFAVLSFSFDSPLPFHFINRWDNLKYPRRTSPFDQSVTVESQEGLKYLKIYWNILKYFKKP